MRNSRAPLPIQVSSTMRSLTLPLALSLVSMAALNIGPASSSTPTQTSGTPGTIHFEDIAAKAGLQFITRNSPTPNKNQVETMVAGVALLDYDGDGYLDIYLVNGAAIPSLQKDSPMYWNRLYRNNHDGTFTDVTERAGVAGKGYGSPWKLKIPLSSVWATTTCPVSSIPHNCDGLTCLPNIKPDVNGIGLLRINAEILDRLGLETRLFYRQRKLRGWLLLESTRGIAPLLCE